MSLQYLDLPVKGREIAQIISDYDPELHLERLPSNSEYLIEQPDKPFAVIHRPFALPEYIIKTYPESMLDERIIAQLFEWDTSRFGGKLDKFDALGHARFLLEERRRADEQEEKREYMKYILNKRRWE